jgi:hypothetical protein
MIADIFAAFGATGPLAVLFEWIMIAALVYLIVEKVKK